MSLATSFQSALCSITTIARSLHITFHCIIVAFLTSAKSYYTIALNPPAGPDKRQTPKDFAEVELAPRGVDTR
jgi:hypothetical protein